MAVIRLTQRLWSEYIRQNRVKAARKAAENRLRRKREALIVEHMPHAAAIARQVWHRFHRGCHVTMDGNASSQGGYGDRITLEDMVSCAYVGLVEAAGRWEPSRGDFAKYSYLRIRGAVVDAHRRQNYVETLHDSIDEWLEKGSPSEVANPGHSRDPGDRDLVARYLTDPRPLAEARVERAERLRLAAAVIERELPDDERAVMVEALGGAAVATIGELLGHSPAWARGKLAAAREKVAAAVRRRAA